VKLPVFLQQQLSPKEGNVIYITEEEYTRVAGDRVMSAWNWDKAQEISQLPSWKEMKGRWIGKHQGAHYYTVGQRKGLQIGGFKEPLFILHTDTTTNTVYVGEGENHIALYQSVVFVPSEHIHFLQKYNSEENIFMARIRYRQILEHVELYQNENGYYFFFQQSQRAIAPGQFIAWYKPSEGFESLAMQLMGSGRMSMR
jgi:tRNA-specific 2-thiouridylase